MWKEVRGGLGRGVTESGLAQGGLTRMEPGDLWCFSRRKQNPEGGGGVGGGICCMELGTCSLCPQNMQVGYTLTGPLLDDDKASLL